MLWLLFPLLAAVAVAIGAALPATAAAGYVAVIAWVAFMLYLIFYRKDRVSRYLDKLSEREREKGDGEMPTLGRREE